MPLNIAAPINSLGYGRVGTELAVALNRRTEVSLWPLGNGVEAETRHAGAVREMLSRRAGFDSGAASLRLWHPWDMAQHVGTGIRSGYTFFELDRLKLAEVHHLKSLDVLFVPSHWAKRVCENQSVCWGRILVVHPGVDADVFSPLPANAIGPTRFLNIGKWEVRKGHDVLCRAFNAAFDISDDVELVMHCHNPCLSEPKCSRYNAEWALMYRNSKLGHKIVVSTERFDTQDEVAELMASADCGVFPARAEGWNLELAEMMAMGKHVIATNYSGHAEFCDADNSLLIDGDEREDAHDGVWFDADDPDWNGTPGRWMKFGPEQMDQLVAHLREIHRRKREGVLGVNTNGTQTASRLTWATAAQAVLWGLHAEH